MTKRKLRFIACRLAGTSLPVGRRLPNHVPRALAKFLGCSESNARMMLAGLRKPNRQMIKMIKLLEQVMK